MSPERPDPLLFLQGAVKLMKQELQLSMVFLYLALTCRRAASTVVTVRSLQVEL